MYLVNLDAKLFCTQYYANNHAEQDQIDKKWIEKNLVSQRKYLIIGRSLIILNKSIKRTDIFPW